MAINRDIAYFLDFKNSIGWDMRLQIIPAGEPKAPDTFTWTKLNGMVVELKGARMDFEDLPMGIMKAPTLSIDINFEQKSDANLAEMLQQPHFTTAGGVLTSNIYTLATNYGSGAVDKFLFVGGQSLELGNEFKVNSSHEVIAVTVQSIDIVKLVMETSSTADFCEFVLDNVTPAATTTDDYNVYARDYRKAGAHNGANEINSVLPFTEGFSDDVKLYSLAQIFGASGLGAFMKSRINAWLRRTGLSPDFGFLVQNDVLRTITLHRQINDGNTALTASEVLVWGEIVRVRNSDSVEMSRTGLLYDESGDESFHSSPYLHELISDIAETFCVKFKWQAVTNDGTNNNMQAMYYVPLFTCGWYRPFESSSGATNSLSTLKVIADGEYTITTAANVVRSCEVELPNISGDNISNVKEDLSGIANTSTWGIKATLYAVPTLPTNVGNERVGSVASVENRLYLRKMVYQVPVTFRFCVPGDKTIINDGEHTPYTLNSPVTFPDLQTLNYQAAVDAAKAWVLETQRTNTPAVAIAKWVTQTFDDADITKRSLDYLMDGTLLQPWGIGDVFTLPSISGSGASNKCVLMSMELDYMTGKASCDFISIKA
jgi:hypothetical protein